MLKFLHLKKIAVDDNLVNDDRALIKLSNFLCISMIEIYIMKNLIRIDPSVR